MIKYENRIKMHEIRRLIEENQYIKAVHIVDTLELTKIKSFTDLSIIADVLIQNERFDDALHVLSKVYAKSRTRRILYQLVDLSIKSKNVEEAERYLLQYIKVAPQDSYRFIFRYSIDKLKNEPYEDLIETLEELKEYDYIEKWAYELAKLYHKAGKKDKCVRECSDIILWFGNGIYVEKAKLLKGYYVGDIDPIRMLKASEKKEAEKRLGLDKTKDYSTLKSEIDKFIAYDENTEDIKEAEVSDELIINDKVTDPCLTEEMYENSKDIHVMPESEIFNKKDMQGTLEEEIYEQTGDIFNKKDMQETPEVEIYKKATDMQEITEVKRYEKATDTREITEDKIYEKAKDMQEITEVKMYELAKETHAITEEVHANSGELHELAETYLVKEAKEAEKFNTSNTLNEAEEMSPDTIGGDFFEDKTEVLFDEKLDRIFSQTNLDYRKLFGYFIHNGVCREEIGNFLDNIIDDNEKHTYLTICGSKKSGKTALAKDIAKTLHGFDRLPSSQIAKISASKINYINLGDNYDKLMDCTLIIEEAGSLNSNGIEKLLRLIWNLEGHIFVILEDTLDNMDMLLSSNEDMGEKFGYRINLPSLTRDDLFHYANHYIKENDYQLTVEAEALLKKIISKIMNSKKAEARLEAIMKVVNEAKLQADNRNKKKLLRIIGSQKLSETDFLYIDVLDFESVSGEE